VCGTVVCSAPNKKHIAKKQKQRNSKQQTTNNKENKNKTYRGEE
jgi:hypothetical protein